MAQLVIPKIDDALEERLKARAGRNGRTLEAEVCAILEEAEPETLSAGVQGGWRARARHREGLWRPHV